MIKIIRLFHYFLKNKKIKSKLFNHRYEVNVKCKKKIKHYYQYAVIICVYNTLFRELLNVTIKEVQIEVNYLFFHTQTSISL